MSIRKRADRAHSAHLQGTLDLLILKTLTRGEMHGYAIAQHLSAYRDAGLDDALLLFESESVGDLVADFTQAIVL